MSSVQICTSVVNYSTKLFNTGKVTINGAVRLMTWEDKTALPMFI